MSSPRLVVFIACSLDGYIADTSGNLDWLDSAVDASEDYGFDAFIADVDLLAMGRGTYDHIAHLEPLPFGERRVEVFTHRPPPAREGVAFVSGSPADAYRRWTAEGVGTVYVDGGVLIASFLSAGLVDEVTITVAPILIGDGHRLFPVHSSLRPLRLESVQSWPSGVVQLRYTSGASETSGATS
jgi:dihydrofolate reductase